MRTEGKARLILVGVDPAKGPKKLAQFEEDAGDLRLGDDWQAADPRRELAWHLVRPGD